MDTIIALGGIILAALVAWISGQRSGRKEADRRVKDALDADKARRLDAGREAVGHGRDGGLSNDERVRRAVEYFEQ